MKKDMPLEGLRWSRDSGSALYDTPQNGRSRTGWGVKRVVNFDVLRQLLGDNAVEDAPEAYEFNWVGKQAARAEVLKPIKKTLRPVKEDSVDWDNTQNIYIEGDNLEVLKLLQKSYLGKVKMIILIRLIIRVMTLFIMMILRCLLMSMQRLRVQ